MNTLRRWDLHQWLVQRPAERRYPQGSHRRHQLEDQRLSGKKESTSSPKQTQIKSGILTLLSGLTNTRVPIVKHGDESKRATPEVGLGNGSGHWGRPCLVLLDKPGFWPTVANEVQELGRPRDFKTFSRITTEYETLAVRSQLLEIALDAT